MIDQHFPLRGKRMVDYLEEHRKAQITWKFRLFRKWTGSRPVITEDIREERGA